MNRRDFIRGAAGLLVAAGAGELLLPERKVWALDRTMLGGTNALYAEWRDLTAHVNGFDIRYTAPVVIPPKIYKFYLNGIEYNAEAIEVRTLEPFSVQLKIGDLQ